MPEIERLCFSIERSRPFTCTEMDPKPSIVTVIFHLEDNTWVFGRKEEWKSSYFIHSSVLVTKTSFIREKNMKEHHFLNFSYNYSFLPYLLTLCYRVWKYNHFLRTQKWVQTRLFNIGFSSINSSSTCEHGFYTRKVLV